MSNLLGILSATIFVQDLRKGSKAMNPCCLQQWANVCKFPESKRIAEVIVPI